MAARFVKVADTDLIPPGEARIVTHEGKRLAVCHVNGAFHAVDDTCTHDGGPLGEGHLIGCEIECPRHGARFDVRTGAVTRMPAAFPVRAYATRVVDGAVEVDLGETE